MSRVPNLFDDTPGAAPAFGANLYRGVCLAAALVMTVVLLARGMGVAALWPAVFAGGFVVLPLRAGGGIFLLALVWMIVADRSGTDPVEMISTVLESLVTAVFLGGRGPSRWGSPWTKLQDPSPVLDLLFCVSVLCWLMSYYRLLSVTRSIFPVDPRRRTPGVNGPRNGFRLGLPREDRRSSLLVHPGEGWKLPAGALAAVLASQLAWAWLRGRSASADLAGLLPLGLGVNVSGGLWRVLLLMWGVGLILIVWTGILGHLGLRRMTPEEAGLYLQDQLWRQTRREQARLNRWLAWAARRERRRTDKKS